MSNHQLALVALVLQEQGRLQERTLRPQLLMGPHPWTRAGYEIALFVPRLPLVLCAKKIKLLKEKQWPEGLSRMPQKTTTASRLNLLRQSEWNPNLVEASIWSQALNCRTGWSIDERVDEWL